VATPRHHPDVDAWFATCANPQKELVQAVRDVVVEADDRVTETMVFHQGASLRDGASGVVLDVFGPGEELVP
jgi:hypothetical protein